MPLPTTPPSSSKTPRRPRWILPVAILLLAALAGAAAWMAGWFTLPAPSIPTPRLSPSPLPSLTPALPLPPPPPAVVLEIDGQSQAGVLNHYCWTSAFQSAAALTACASQPAIQTPSLPLLVPGASYGRLSLSVDDFQLDQVLVVYRLYPSDEIAASAHPGSRNWKPSMGPAFVLDLNSHNEFVLQPALDPGLWAIFFTARWSQSGNADYGFLLQVGDSGSAPLTLAPASTASVTAQPGQPDNPLYLRTLAPLARVGKGSIERVAVSPGGLRMAAATPLGIYQYATASLQLAWFFPARTGWSALVFSPDGSRLAAATSHGLVYILDPASGRSLLQFQSEGYPNLAWAPDGLRLVSGANCQTVTVWDARTGQPLKQLRDGHCSDGYSGISVAWPAGGSRIIAAPSGIGLLAWDTATYAVLPDIGSDDRLLERGMPQLLPSPDGRLLAYFDAYGGSVLIILNVQDGHITRVIQPPPLVGVISMAWAADSRRLAANLSSITPLGLIWDTQTGQVLQQFDGYKAYPGFGWLNDQSVLAGLASLDGMLTILDLSSGTPLAETADHASPAAYMAWTSDGLITSTDGMALTWWDIQTGRARQKAIASTFQARLFSIPKQSPDGKRIVDRNEVQDAVTRKVLVYCQSAGGADPFNNSLSTWSPDGRRLASINQYLAQPVILWDPDTGKILQQLGADTVDQRGWFQSLAWSPDGSTLAAAGSQADSVLRMNGMVILWDVAAGKQIAVLNQAMYDPVSVLSWSDDSRFLAAGLSNGNIVIWERGQTVPRLLLQGHAGPVSAMAWSYDSKFLSSLSDDKTLLVWDLQK